MQFNIITDFKTKQISLAFTIPLTETEIRFTIHLYRSPNKWAKGISSRCTNGKHVLFFDYDKMDRKQIIDEIQYLQKHFALPHAYLFKLDKQDSWHVIIPSKHSLREAFKILSESNTDYAHKESVKRARGHEWVLRVTGKGKREPPIFDSLIFSNLDVRPVSTAHKNFIETWYEIEPIKYKNEDNITVLPKIDYNTGNKVD